ncbi:MAG: DsrE family protein [Bacteroidota bacterium]
MKKFLCVVAVLFSTLPICAQSTNHKIVFDLNDGDTAVHSTVLRQFTNILKAAPDAELELVCYGPALYMFVKEKMHFEEKIKELKSKGKVSFKLCANSMQRLNIDKSQTSDLAEVIPVAILELSNKQREGWTYIKAGM